MRIVHHDVDCTGRVVDEEHLAPMRATVGRFEDAAVGIVCIDVPHRGRIHDVRVARIDDDLSDRVRVPQTGVAPGLAGIGRLVDTVARNKRVADIRLARTGINDIRVRRRDRQRANAIGSVELAVRNVRPGEAVVCRAPYAAVDTAEIERKRRAGHGIDRNRASPDSRTDVAPVQRAHHGLRGRRSSLRGSRNSNNRQRYSD